MNGIDWCANAIKGPTPAYVRGKPYLGWATPTGYGDRDSIERAFGLVNAIDPATGQLRWRYRIPSPPVAGLVATAGSLILTADTEGDLFALNAKTGELLHQARLGAGAIDGGCYLRGQRQAIHRRRCGRQQWYLQGEGGQCHHRFGVTRRLT